MEASVKTWLLRLLVVVPTLSLIISVVVWKANFEEEIQKLRDEVSNIQREKRTMDEETVHGRGLTTERGGGAVYVHWGREDCPSTADIVYTGVAGGGHYSHNGAAANLLCMTHTPVWARYGNDANSFTYLYGTEYDVASDDFPLGHDRAEKIHNHDVPCTVCQTTTRTSVIMIPGTTVCVEGWTAEYVGYLMAGSHEHVSASEYTCIDANPDAHESGAANENGRLLYRVKGKCGSLPCPPYVEMRELTCVVCTK